MKNKIVHFPPNGVPRYFTTSDAEYYQNKLTDGVLLVNPNLDMVLPFGVPPELWTLDENGQVIPKSGPELEAMLKQRAVTGAMEHHNKELKENIHKLIDIPALLEAFMDKLQDRADQDQSASQMRAYVLGQQMQAERERGEAVFKASILEMKNFIQFLSRDLDKKVQIIQWSLAALGVANIAILVKLFLLK